MTANELQEVLAKIDQQIASKKKPVGDRRRMPGNAPAGSSERRSGNDRRTTRPGKHVLSRD